MQGLSSRVRFNFGFGDAVCVRDALMNFYNPHMGEHHEILSMEDMGYPGSGPGLPELVEDTKQLIKHETLESYDHVIITNGASMGIILALRAMREVRNLGSVIGYRRPYFFHYPNFSDKAGFTFGYTKEDSDIKFDVDVALVDSPTNPDGKIVSSHGFNSTMTLWDATYSNGVFCNILSNHHFKHDAAVGSFGKLFGLTGVRLGWVATNDADLAKRITKLNYETTLGISVPSQRLISNVISNIDLLKFTKEARLQVDCNREEMSKLEYLSSDSSTVPLNGMFFWTKMDDKAVSLLERCGVSYTRGIDCGGSPEHVRLNLAQSRKLTKDMVKMVRRVDGKR